MFTYKDIESRTIFVVNCFGKERNLRVLNGELLLDERTDEKKTTLTKFPFQKILALFVIGHITITTPLIEQCKKHGVGLVVMKPNLRPIFYWAESAEGNFLLRRRQHMFGDNDVSIAKILVKNKIGNQLALLQKTRKKDDRTLEAVAVCKAAIDTVDEVDEYSRLLGLEGVVSKTFFAAYFHDLDWHGRRPRVKTDVLNVTLDIGYTILFNYMECFARLFGFDIFVGVYHRLWYNRKSLICDLVEPFRCIIDHCVLLAYRRKQFSAEDFVLSKGEYRLRPEMNASYYRVFYDCLIVYKAEFFKYVQTYYRSFMGKKSAYPVFKMK